MLPAWPPPPRYGNSANAFSTENIPASKLFINRSPSCAGMERFVRTVRSATYLLESLPTMFIWTFHFWPPRAGTASFKVRGALQEVAALFVYEVS